MEADIVGVALAGGFGNTYIPTLSDSSRREVLEWLLDKKWVAFNTVFDGSFIVAQQQKIFGGEWRDYTPALQGDMLIAFKMFANEGWPGQRHNLGVAIDTLLGWEDSQKGALDILLAKHSLSKGEMGKLSELEPEAFAKYGAMDAEACYQLMALLGGYLRDFRQAGEAYSYYITLVQLVVEQKLRGVRIDRHNLALLQQELVNSMTASEQEFRTLPEVREYLEQYETPNHVKEELVVSTKTVRAKLSDAPWDHPKVWTKVDKPPKAKWEEEHGCWERDVTCTRVKYKKIKEARFNIQSKAHLRNLFFSHLGYTPTEKTETGLGKVDKKVLPKLGKPGEVITKYNKDLKLLGYVNKLTERSESGIMRYDLQVHGTVTGRSAGRGGLNIQQLAKDERYLQCFIAREGYTLIDTDFTSLENVVLAEASRDPGLLELYASGKPHDSYLYVACFLFPKAGISEVYCPDSPTLESVAKAKKKFKHYRSIAKVVVLASNYGAGAGKIHATLLQSGVDISFEEVQEIHKRYWELFAGIKKFEARLVRECRARDGYIFNGLGRPICVIEDYLKDINNKYCQSTGVGLLHLYLSVVDELRRERGVEMYPWIVDTHDQTTWEVKEGQEEAARQVFADAYVQLNERINPLIPLKGDIEIGETLWEFKKG